MNVRVTHRGWQRAFALYLAILIVIIGGAYARLVPVQIAVFPLYDKLGHFFLLGMAAYLGHRATGRRHVQLGALRLPLAPLLVALAAFAEECLQSVSPYRSFSMLDYACDLAGIALFYLVDRALAGRSTSAQ